MTTIVHPCAQAKLDPQIGESFVPGKRDQSSGTKILDEFGGVIRDVDTLQRALDDDLMNELAYQPSTKRTHHFQKSMHLPRGHTLTHSIGGSVNMNSVHLPSQPSHLVD